MTGWCECCAYEFCIYDDSPNEDQDYCYLCEEVFQKDDLTWMVGGDFCEICLEIVVDTIADEEMMFD
jgi:hypothetical protein